MKKAIFLLSFILCIVCAHAGPYYTGINQLNNLLKSVGKQENSTSDPNSNDGGKKTMWETGDGPQKGFIWQEKGYTLSYQGSDNYKYITGIDWSNGKGNEGNKYVQVLPLVLEQKSPIPPSKDAPEPDRTSAQENELRLLNTLNLSGNEFNNFTFNANNQARETTSLSINLSNNIGSNSKTTWTNIAVKNFVTPSQVTVNISNNALSFAALSGTGLTLDIQSGINVVRTPQTINKAAAFPTIDISAELFSAETAYKFYYDNTELVAGTDYTDNGDGTFVFESTYLNKTISCKLTDPTFSDFDFGTNCMEYKIALAGNPTELALVDVTPKSSDTFVGEPIQFTATALNYNGAAAENITYLWSCTADAGIFDDEISATPIFTPAIAGNIEVTCIATQGDVVKDNTVTIVPVAVTSLEMVFEKYKFFNDIHVQNEIVTIPVKANGTEITRTSFLNALTLGEDMAIQNGKLVYTPSSTGDKSLTISIGEISSTAKNLKIIANNPISKSGMDVIECSNEDVSHPKNNIKDGNESTRWATISGGEQYVTIDLGKTYDLSMLQISWEAANAEKYEIWTGLNVDNLSKITEQSGITSGQVNTRISCLSPATRYLKILCVNPASVHKTYSIYEIYVYGELTVGNSSNNVVKESEIFYANNELNILIEDAVSTTIYSISGKEVLNSKESIINLSSLDAGYYIAKVTDKSGKVFNYKFVK